MRLFECPISWITKETSQVLEVVTLAVDSGYLLFSGGWGKQPYWFVEAYQIYKEEVARWQEKETQKSKTKNGNKSN